MPDKKVITYLGKPLESLSKEELIKAIEDYFEYANMVFKNYEEEVKFLIDTDRRKKR